jgi:eukaryotic-like serine/threonine-protein kinase
MSEERAPAARLAGGRIGHYEILGTLGAGGMGEVFRARDTSLGRDVALKILPETLASDPEKARRLEREARAASALNHPNIVTVYEVGSADGRSYIVMELVEGKTLRQAIDAGPLTSKTLLDVACQIASGLARAHEAGIVHRDLKPENVMTSRDGLVKILDFGLAKRMPFEGDAGSAEATRTQDGAVMGTVGYMSPEQAAGQPVDFRSDQFSFGSILYEMVTGERAFQKETSVETLAAIIREESKPIAPLDSRVPSRLLWIIDRCLAKNPEDRYASTRDLARDLAATRDQSSTASGTESPGRVRGWPLAAAGALVVLTVALIALRAIRVHAPGSGAPAEPRLVRLTSTGGLNTDPALSREGTLLAYASDRAGGNFDIYAQPVGGGDAVRLTDDPADESEPSFSADGARIVFSRREAGLYVIGALGGEPRPIVRIPWARTPRFSPDGRWISYWTGFPPSVVAGGVPGALGSLFIVAADGGQPRAIRTPLASARYPIWSPDGGHILFLGEEDSDQKTHDWYVIPRDGGSAIKTGAVQALRAAGLRTAFPIPGAWRTRDNAVVFAANEIGSSNVWQIPISPSTGRVSGSPRRVTFGSAVERSPVVAESGRIAFASIVENVGIWRMPLDANTGVPTGALERVTNDAASATLRSVSSDGKTLFSISSRAGRNEVWTRDLQTDREHRLTYSGIEEASASPDASRVALARNEAGKRHIELITAADGDGRPSQLCDQCYGPAGWSPDGERLLYCTGSPTRLLQYDFRTGRAAELVRHPTWSLDRPRFSPDGRWVAFHSANSPNVRQIYAIPAVRDGPVPQEAWVPVVTDHGCHPSWSPDGALLYYFSFRDGAFCPWVQRVDPATKRPIGPPRAVMHFHHPGLRASSGAAAFNDVQAGYLYLTLTEATGNIWMIDGQGR